MVLPAAVKPVLADKVGDRAAPVLAPADRDKAAAPVVKVAPVADKVRDVVPVAADRADRGWDLIPSGCWPMPSSSMPTTMASSTRTR